MESESPGMRDVRLETLRAELQVHHAERLILHAELRNLATSRDTTAAQNQQLRHSLELERNLRIELEAETADAQRELKRVTWENDDRQIAHYKEQGELQAKVEALETECLELKRKAEALKNNLPELQEKTQALEKDVVELRAARERAQTLLREEEFRRREMLHSYSWKITGPLREILGMFRSQPKGKPPLP